MSYPKDLTKYPLYSDEYVPFAFNVKKTDEYVNSNQEKTVDRAGKERFTWLGIEEANRRAREALNYKEVDYVAGNKIDGLLQYVISPDDGNAYVINPSVELPYTLTGDWTTDSPNFWLGMDSTLRVSFDQFRESMPDIFSTPTPTPHVKEVQLADQYNCFVGHSFKGEGGRVNAIVSKQDSHQGSTTGKIVKVSTIDGFASIYEESTIIETDGVVQSHIVGGDFGQRVGFAYQDIGSGVAREPVFAYSDDGGISWVSIRFSFGEAIPSNFNANPYGRIYSEEGVHYIYFYSNNILGFSKSTDNGTTWSPIDIAIDNRQSPFHLTENWLTKTRTGVLFICRTTVGKMAYAHGTWEDLGSLELSDFELGENPIYVIEHPKDGSKWIYSTNRAFFSIDDSIVNSLYACKFDPDIFLNSSGSSGIGSRIKIAQLRNWGTGYINVLPYTDRVDLLINSGEFPKDVNSQSGGGNSVILISGSPTQGGGNISHQPFVSNMITNGFFTRWSKGAQGVHVNSNGLRSYAADAWTLGTVAPHGDVLWSKSFNGSNLGESLIEVKAKEGSSIGEINLVNLLHYDDVRGSRTSNGWCSVRFSISKMEGYMGGVFHCYIDGYESITPTLSSSGTNSSRINLGYRNYFLDDNLKEITLSFKLPKEINSIGLRFRYLRPSNTQSGANDGFRISNVSVLNTYERNVPIAYDENVNTMRSMRYVYATSYGTPNPGNTSLSALSGMSAFDGINSAYMELRYPSEMMRTPEVSFFSTVGGEIGRLRNITKGTSLNGEIFSVSGSAKVIIRNSQTASQGDILACHVLAEAKYW